MRTIRSSFQVLPVFHLFDVIMNIRLRRLIHTPPFTKPTTSRGRLSGSRLLVDPVLSGEE